MIVLKRIIGYETPEIKFKPANIQDSRPNYCPCCFALAVSGGKFNLVGHGTYRRWVKTPEEFQLMKSQDLNQGKAGPVTLNALLRKLMLKENLELNYVSMFPFLIAISIFQLLN